MSVPLRTSIHIKSSISWLRLSTVVRGFRRYSKDLLLAAFVAASFSPRHHHTNSLGSFPCESCRLSQVILGQVTHRSAGRPRHRHPPPNTGVDQAHRRARQGARQGAHHGALAG